MKKRFATFRGETLSTTRWAERVGIPRATMENRLKRVELGLMTMDSALSPDALPRGGDKRTSKGYVNERMVTHDGRTQSVKAWAIEVGRSPQVMATRIKRWEAGAYTEAQAFGRDPLPRGFCQHAKGKRIRPALSAMMVAMADTPYAEDPFAQCVVNRHRGEGIELDKIGELYGLSRERVRQIETSALRKLRMAFAGKKFEIIDALRTLDSMRKANPNTFELEEQIEYGDNRKRKTPRRPAKVAP
jgi:hypothetical protein